MKKPYTQVEVDQIFVRANEVFTVFVQNISPNKWFQIEIRCLKNGNPEIFCDGLELKSFDTWSSIKD